MEKTKRKTGGIAKFIEEAKSYRDDPTVLNNIIDAMSEKIDELQAKASAYDRLTSDGLTMKELANIIKHPVAIENDEGQNALYYFGGTPHVGQYSDGTQFWSCSGSLTTRKWRLPRQLVNFTGDWITSLALPDGWEEK